METVIKNFYAGMKDEGVEVKIIFLGRLKNAKHDLGWLSGLNYELLLPSTLKGIIFRKAIESQRLAKLIMLEKPDACIALNSGAIERLKSARDKSVFFYIYSWVHFSLKIFNHPEILREADYHFSISSGITRELEQELLIPSNKIATVFNPLPPIAKDRVLPRPNNGTSVFLFVGRLVIQKNPNLLVDSFSDLRGDWKLHIVGDGPLREELEKKVESRNLQDKIILHGWKKNCWKFISTLGPISALVLTSDNEGFPMVLLEAASRGLFCIASNCPTGPADIITTQNGVLFRVGDRDSLKSALEKVIQQKGVPEVPSETIKASVAKFALKDFCRKILKSIEDWEE